MPNSYTYGKDKEKYIMLPVFYQNNFSNTIYPQTEPNDTFVKRVSFKDLPAYPSIWTSLPVLHFLRALYMCVYPQSQRGPRHGCVLCSELQLIPLPLYHSLPPDVPFEYDTRRRWFALGDIHAENAFGCTLAFPPFFHFSFCTAQR